MLSPLKFSCLILLIYANILVHFTNFKIIFTTLTMISARSKRRLYLSLVLSWKKLNCRGHIWATSTSFYINLLLHWGREELQIPFRQSIDFLPINVYPLLHVKLTVWPCSKLSPVRAPFRGVPGSLQFAKNNESKVVFWINLENSPKKARALIG